MIKRVGVLLLFCSCLVIARIDPFFLPEEEDSGVNSSAMQSISSSVKKMQALASSSSASILHIDYGFLKVAVFDDHLEIKSKDRLKKHFLLSHPKKIVFDFSARRGFPTKKKILHHPKFPKLFLGAHKTYYRLAISYKGRCKNRLKKQGSTLVLFCE